MDAITFRYLISLTVSEGLDMCLMDVITTYLYEFIDTDIHMKNLVLLKSSQKWKGQKMKPNLINS